MEAKQEPQQRTRDRHSYQSSRSRLSTNWRVKEETPRTESEQNLPGPNIQSRFQRKDFQGRNNNTSDSNYCTTDRRPVVSHCTRLYIGNLLYSAQRADVFELFKSNGFNVVNLDMSIDPMTGRNPSYCFLDLETPEEASRAMKELNGEFILGREVKIKPGVPKKEPASPLNMRTKSYGKGWKELEVADTYKPSFDRWTRTDASTHWNQTYEESKRVFVGNLPRMEPQAAVDSAIQQLFSMANLMPTAVSKIISPQPPLTNVPGNHYYLFVDLPTAGDADLAVEKLHGVLPSWGVPVKVRKAVTGNKDRKVNREQFGYEKGKAGGEESEDYPLKGEEDL